MIPPTTRVLIVDDMQTIRDMVKTNLKNMGIIKVYEAENGEMGLRIMDRLDNDETPVDYIISDWNMPVMKGIDFLKRIRSNEKYANLPFVMLTTESEKSLVTEAIIGGVSQYIIKPFSFKI